MAELAQSPVLKQRTLANADYVRAWKEYDPKKIYTINGIPPKNSSPPLPKTLYNSNGDPIIFDENGFPDFTAHVHEINGKKQYYEIDMKGTYEGANNDFGIADSKAGITKQYREDNNLTWHHHEDGKTMMLVPKDINGIPHTGGASIVEHNRNFANILYFPKPIIP